jgi:transcriptional regulator with XRE-family HTH domain
MVSPTRALDVRSKMIGVLLRAARLKAGKTVKECAKWLGCSSHIMSQYEHGRRPISLPELEALAKVFRVPADHLWDEGVATPEQPQPDPDRDKLMELRHKEIGVLLRQARTEAGKTQRQCADILGVSPDTMSKYEFGNKPVPFTQLETMASYLETPLTSFLNEGVVTNSASGDRPDLATPQEAWAGLPPEIKEFIRSPGSLPYLQMALRLYELPQGSLKQLAQAMLSAQSEGGREAL